jgi:integrase
VKSGKTVKTWSPTRVQGLLRHNKSGRYYARFFSGGKESWVPLDTTLFEVAKAKMEKDETVTGARQGRVDDKRALTGKMTVADAVERYKADLAQRINLKESSRQFWLWNLDSIVTSWPGLLTMDIRKVTETHCKHWAAQVAPTMSASYFNNGLVNLKRIFEVGVKEGLIHRNPTKIIERKRERKKSLALPSQKEFWNFVQAIRDMNRHTSEDAADLVELLAFTGCRISEAQGLQWGDVNFAKRQIFIKGDPVTGTKNWESRYIPILPNCEDLLRRLEKKRPHRVPADPIIQLGDIRESMAKASTAVGIEKLTHHDLRHLFATICIESGVDIPTVSRWLGHKDGGALAMKTYGHLRVEHSLAQAQRVSFGKNLRKSPIGSKPGR